MSLRAAVVPVLPSWAHPEEVPLSALSLHGEALYVHAARALGSMPGARVFVTTPTGGGLAVERVLTDAGLAGVRVIEDVHSAGAALAAVLDKVPDAAKPASGHEVGMVLLHDPRCPLVPTSFLREVLDRAEGEPEALHMGARAVTDTVKVVDDGLVLTTVDRNVLRLLTSPLVVSVSVLRQLHSDGRLVDCAEIADVLELARSFGKTVRWAIASSLTNRIAEASEIALLECLVEVRADTRS